MATLDGLMEHFSQRIEVLVEEKKVMEVQAERSLKRLEEEVVERKVTEEKLGWFL